MTFDKVERALADIRAGRMVILVDDEDRENEGDLCLAAECITPEAVNFMARHARGLICLTLTEERLAELNIPLMVVDNTSMYNTAFTVSIEARHGVSTGISAADRATTIRVAMDPNTRSEDLVRPGHIFPLRARKGGVLVRTGQTEGSVDIARLAGFKPAGVICEIMNDDGTMARMPDLQRFAAEHHLPILSIAELIQYRLAHESFVNSIEVRKWEHPQWGPLTLHVYGTQMDGRQHLAVVKGDLKAGVPLVRVHASHAFSCIFADVLGGEGNVMAASLARLAQETCGVLVWLDGRSDALTLQDWVLSLSRVDHDTPDQAAGALRELGVGAQILRDLGLHHIRVLSDHPRRLVGLDGYGLHVDDVLPQGTHEGA